MKDSVTQPQQTGRRSGELLSTGRGAEDGARRVHVRLLCAAAVLHLAVSLTVYALGRYAVSPGTFDSDGVAVAFASDGVRYRADAAALSEALRGGEIRHWAGADRPFHVKLYSVCFALFGPWLGYNVVGAEPLNASCYLATLALVFSLGREVFNRRAGLWAAGAVALWLARAEMGEMLIATVLLGALLVAARQLQERRVRATNLAVMALLVAAAVGVPQVMPNALELGRSPSVAEWRARREALGGATAVEAAAATPEDASRTSLWSRAAAHVASVRRRFVEMYPDTGSNIDGDVQINNTADLLRYLPRAAVVGFFAPFPNMWFARGKSVGYAGRLLGALESLAMYAVEGLALLGVWRGRRQLSVWLLLSVAATGVTALGLVAVNVGALYRLRYVFLMFLIIPAAEGAAHILERLSKRPRGVEERGEAG